MSDWNVYQITPTVSSLPTFLVMAKNELSARATVTGTLNSRFSAHTTPVRVNGIAMLDQCYLDSSNATCQQLEDGKDYVLLSMINETQISIGIGEQRHIVSSVTGTPTTTSHETTY